MVTECRKCKRTAHQEAKRPDHLGFDGVVWRPFCELHLKTQISKYELEIRRVGAK
jgi:hypothetical protein